MDYSSKKLLAGTTNLFCASISKILPVQLESFWSRMVHLYTILNLGEFLIKLAGLCGRQVNNITGLVTFLLVYDSIERCHN